MGKEQLSILSSYFSGKKWNMPPSHSNAEFVLRPDEYGGGGLYIDDEYVENW